MITKCRYCDFKRETKLNLDMLRASVDTEAPYEDRMLWLNRLILNARFKEWNGVKIHMGRKHKGEAYYGMWPDGEFSEEEKAIINESGLYS